jgi:hypothetical protein
VPDLAAIPGVAELWELTRGEPSVRIAVIDGPAELTHPCFEGATLEIVAPSWLPREPDLDEIPGGYEARLEHGTWVASVLFGRPGSDVTGLAAGCTGVLITSLRGERSDNDPISAARAIECAVEAGAHVIVAELCLPSRSGDVDDLLKRVLRGATRQGVLTVAAAGNEKGLSTCFPAAVPEVLAVGAHDDDGRVFGFSNWGPEYAGHGLVAPGGNMVGAIPGGGTRVHKGTSCSTPVVAGIAGLLLSLQAKLGAVPDPAGVRQALLSTAAPCSARDTDGNPQRCIGGRLDVPAATEFVLSELKRSARRRGVVAAGLLRRGVRASSLDPDTATPPVAGTPVFALGKISYDFGTQARRDSFARFLAGDAIRYADTSDELAMADHLGQHPTDVMGLTWTLRLDAAPIYAIVPAGAHAVEIDAQLIRLLRDQQAPRDFRVERVTLPGRLTGDETELLSGEVVPVVELSSTRGLGGFIIGQLASAASARVQPSGTEEALPDALREFLARVFFDMANLGRTPAQRALNFAGTNTFQAAHSIFTALRDGKVIDTIDTQRSQVCRPDSDCWDVRLSFFDPENNRRSRDVHRFTFDVSDTVPVTLNDPQAWPEPPAASYTTQGLTM